MSDQEILAGLRVLQEKHEAVEQALEKVLQCLKEVAGGRRIVPQFSLLAEAQKALDRSRGISR